MLINFLKGEKPYKLGVGKQFATKLQIELHQPKN